MAPDPSTTALVDLYAVHAPRLAGLARVLGVPTGECEDVAQEAFLRLHRRWDSMADRRDVPAYLRTTVVNLARDRARRRTHPWPNAGHALGADVEAGGRAALDGLAAALGDLPDRQRECVALRFYGELSDREIAGVTGLSLGSVKTHLRRGIAALRPALAPLLQTTDAPSTDRNPT